jgi:hypothetical protein
MFAWKGAGEEGKTMASVDGKPQETNMIIDRFKDKRDILEEKMNKKAFSKNIITTPSLELTLESKINKKCIIEKQERWKEEDN